MLRVLVSNCIRAFIVLGVCVCESVFKSIKLGPDTIGVPTVKGVSIICYTSGSEKQDPGDRD